MTPSDDTPRALPRSAFRAYKTVTTRWTDHDLYGQVSNVVCQSWFDTMVNTWLIEQGGLDVRTGGVIGLVVETHCNYFAPLAFPAAVEVGMRVACLGNSSVRYEMGLYAQGEEFAAVQGRFVHVYVDRKTRQPVSLPGALRAALETLL